MNSDYVLKGRGQITLHQPDWARFAPASGSRASNAGTATAPISDNPISDNHASNSPLPTQKSTQKPTQSPTDTAQTEQTDRPRFNNFIHSGSKKSVGPDVDTVDYTFEDFLDTINPLQQIPVVNMVYRHLTGDKISGVAQVMGSALFWGPTGIITGAVDAIFEQEKGGDMGETIMASLLGTETPNARNLPSNNPSNNPGKNPITHAPVTMLAEAEPELIEGDETAIAVAASNVPAAQHKLATKQPFGGVMGNEPPAAAMPVPANANLAEANSAPTITAAANPTPHAPVQADGRKLYSLAGVIRHVGSPATMPLREMPDTRLKSYDKIAKPKTGPALDQDPAALLGLTKPTTSIAAFPSLDDMDGVETRLPSPGLSAPIDVGSFGKSTPSGNPIPAELIQDMMLMNMQKYQDGLKNGTSRGGSLDING